MKIEKILIANRGEIAVRVIRTCRELGITPVAVYSEADRQALHVLQAQEAVEIGPAAPLESYLNIERIITAAKERKCQAVHPGYGFLSENAQFARRCQEEGLIFIGPSAEAMEMVGDKLTARETMRKAGVPITPGAEIHGDDWPALRSIAETVGYPLMVKASAGGGGKGMRIVHTPEQLQAAVEAGRREAKSAFGNATVYIEKYLQKPRHVEFQVLADQHGNVVHLFERECSIQRRHQKIIEETPSPALYAQLRRQMGETACRVMEAVGYNNAGTVEFLLDEEKNFYFLEVNARIQVEHPVTELVAGVDLVKEQIRIAEGEPLHFQQADLVQRGCAIECRIYAEDPENNFFTSIGTVHLVKEPQGPGVRCDSGIYSGLEITHHYDPILAKLITWADDRESARKRMIAALSDYVILGVKTPIPFLKAVLEHPAFIEGDLHTGFIPQHFPDWSPRADADLLPLALAAAAVSSEVRKQASTGAANSRLDSPWQTIGAWDMFGKRK